MKQAKWRVHNRRGRLINHLLTLRGFNSSSLEPDFVSGLHDPNLLPDMAKAREIVRRAVKENWPVAVFGDYDADGTPGAALLYELFERLGLHCTVFLPTRAEGYGLNIEATQKIGKSAKLLVRNSGRVRAPHHLRDARPHQWKSDRSRRAFSGPALHPQSENKAPQHRREAQALSHFSD